MDEDSIDDIEYRGEEDEIQDSTLDEDSIIEEEEEEEGPPFQTDPPPPPQSEEEDARSTLLFSTPEPTTTTSTTSPMPASYVEDKYHMIVSMDNTAYNHWMVQVCYYHYLKAKEAFPDSALGGFTRLLHANTTDFLMERIPTVRVDELPVADLTVEDWIIGYYAPLNRPYAFFQFMRDHLHTIPERYIFMSEPDHIIMRPLPLPSSPEKPLSSSFWYMGPQWYPQIIEKFNPTNVPIEHFYPTGNAPTIMAREQIAAISEKWYEFTRTLLHTKEYRDAIGWVLEMYSFVFAAATTLEEPIHFEIRDDIQTHPPREDLYIHGTLANIFHFTYAGYMNATNHCRYEGEERILGAWEWDKRDFPGAFPPRNFLPPPSNDPSCDSMRMLIGFINEASAASPYWEQFVAKDRPYVWIEHQQELLNANAEPVPAAVQLPMDQLLNLYFDHYASFTNDFSDYLETMRAYAQKCSSIMVAGQGTCTALWPLLKGLHQNAEINTTKSLVASEKVFHPNVDEVARVASGLGIQYTFLKQPSLEVDISGYQEYDLLFIDTWHVYGQLKRELEKYAPKTRKYIMLHDTKIDGVWGESVRVGWNTTWQALEFGMPEEEVKMGLKPAVDDFLATHPEWSMELLMKAGNGLTILSRLVEDDLRLAPENTTAIVA